MPGSALGLGASAIWYCEESEPMPMSKQLWHDGTSGNARPLGEWVDPDIGYHTQTSLAFVTAHRLSVIAGHLHASRGDLRLEKPE
jgi:hypothetical protein